MFFNLLNRMSTFVFAACCVCSVSSLGMKTIDIDAQIQVCHEDLKKIMETYHNMYEFERAVNGAIEELTLLSEKTEHKYDQIISKHIIEIGVLILQFKYHFDIQQFANQVSRHPTVASMSIEVCQKMDTK